MKIHSQAGFIYIPRNHLLFLGSVVHLIENRFFGDSYAGVDPKTVQYLAGHENSKTTMDIYAKVKYNRPEELIGVVNRALT